MRVDTLQEDDQGAVAVIVILLMTSLLGIVVLTVDAGGMLMKRRELVNAADAGALAAAQWCAETKGALDQSGSAQGAADAVARSNVSDAANTAFALSAPCPGPSGEVSLTYRSNQKLFFGPALGFNDEEPVSADATAIWGPAGAAKNVVPIMVSLDQAVGDCKVVTGPINERCAFWYDIRELGTSQWGFLDLSAWDVAPGASCPNTGASTRTDWILDGYPDPLPLNYPNATYVCTTNGHSDSVWETLAAMKGEILSFPVSDPATTLFKNNNDPDKYNIVGFTALRLIDVYDGNSEEAIGSTASSESCGGKIGDIGGNAVVGLSFFVNCFALPPATISNLVVEGKPDKKRETLSPGVHYSYNASLAQLTFWDKPLGDVSINFTVNTPGSAGICEPPERDPAGSARAECVLAEWVGFVETGIDPRPGGLDLGIRAIRLTE